MFDAEFYPTPKGVIEIMLKPYQKRMSYSRGWASPVTYDYIIEGSILEPSAGKGDILDFICNNTRRSEPKGHYVIEQQPELQSILRDKGYQLVANDFLNYKCDMYYDHIIMNPPFSNGDEHLLKAIEISENTQITCILNAKTIKNPFSRKRQELLSLIELYGGTVEYVEKGFSDAERKTEAEIAIVRIHVIKENQTFDFNFKDSEQDEIDFQESYITNEVMRNDAIGNMIDVYEKAKSAFIEHMKAEAKFHYYASYITRHFNYQQVADLDSSNGNYKDRYNAVSVNMKSLMWKYVIQHLNIEKYMSHSVIQNFEKFIKQQSKMAFTKENTQDFFEMIMLNASSIMDTAVVEVFDSLTKHYSENRMNVEGWKTNDAYKVNKKVIIPYGCKMSWEGQNAKSYGTEFQSNFHLGQKYSDLDKVMCYLSGSDMDKIKTIDQAMTIQFKEIGKLWPGDKFINTCESEFFKIKFFKKGTVHLEFKDTYLWQQFNLRAAKGKNWLPESQYSDIKEKQKSPSSTNDELLLEFEV